MVCLVIQSPKKSNRFSSKKGSHVQEMETQLVQVGVVIFQTSLSWKHILLSDKVIMDGCIGSTFRYQMVVDPTPIYGLMSPVIHLQNCSQLPD